MKYVRKKQTNTTSYLHVTKFDVLLLLLCCYFDLEEYEVDRR